MSDKKKRMAGDAVKEIYGGEKEYGSWGDTWDHGAEQQQLRASGSYDKDSDLAKQFAGMKENISSRVDDEEGWRQLDIDGSLKDPKAYQDLVEKWSGAGFDVRAIDMAKGFHSSNIAVRRAGGAGTGEDVMGEDPSSTEDPKPITPPTPPAQGEQDPWESFPGGGYGVDSQTQNVQQDNDINSTVTGDNNVVSNQQDNSVRQVGGSDFLGGYLKKHNFFK